MDGSHAKKLRVRVLTDAQQPIEASVTRLSATTLQLAELTRPLPVHESVVIELFGYLLRGQTRPAGPQEALVELQSAREVFLAIEAVDELLSDGDAVSNLSEPSSGDDEDVTLWVSAQLASTLADPSTTANLPSLDADGTVRFRSWAQFVGHWKHSLSQGGLLTRGIVTEGVGRSMSLVVDIPGAPAPIVLRDAPIVLARDGCRGFAVDREVFRKMLADPRPPTPAPSAPPRPTTPHHAHFVGGLDARSVLREADDRNTWFTRLVDEVLVAEQDVVCVARCPAQGVRFWVRLGHIVAAERWPANDGDRIGARLIAEGALDFGALEHALAAAQVSGRPIGGYLTEALASPVQLHDALRTQILDRVSLPARWSAGRLEIHRWSPPPARAELPAVKRTTVLTHLVRTQAQHLGPPALRALIRSCPDRSIEVDVAQVPTSSVSTAERIMLTSPPSVDRLDGWAARAEAVSGGLELVLLGLVLGFLRPERAPERAPAPAVATRLIR